jgi:hypothetical protein
MKKVIIILIFILLVPLLILFTNKTFFKDNIIMEDKLIKIPMYSYHFSSEEGKIKLLSVRSFSDLNNEIAKHIEYLPSCYDEGYRYDESADITFSNYQVNNRDFYNEIDITYENGNLCEDEYVLDTDWYINFVNDATISESFITKCSDGTCNKKILALEDVSQIISVISAIDTMRIENKNNIPSGEDVVAEIYYEMNDELFTLSIYKHNYYLAFNISDQDDHSKNAIYYIINGNILNEIYDKSNNS